MDYSLAAIMGVIVLLLGTLAFVAGFGQMQSANDFEDRLDQDRSLHSQGVTNNSSYSVCRVTGQGNLDCADNPYTGWMKWVLGGFVVAILGGAVVYHDIRGFDQI